MEWEVYTNEKFGVLKVWERVHDRRGAGRFYRIRGAPPVRGWSGLTYSFADVAERLMARFEGKVPLDVVVRVARESEADLYRAGAPQGEALAELVERSAEQRLVDLIDRGLVAGEAGGAGGELVDGDDPTGPVPSPRPPS